MIALQNNLYFCSKEKLFAKPMNPRYLKSSVPQATARILTM